MLFLLLLTLSSSLPNLPVFSNTLPAYGGSYQGPLPLRSLSIQTPSSPSPLSVVGTIDVEVPAPLQSFGTAVLKSNGQPALQVRSSSPFSPLASSPPVTQLETLLFTLFYPAGNQGSGKHLDWLQRPLSTTTGGYARFLGRPKWLLLPAFWLLAGSTSLPGWMDASLADKVSGGKEVEEGTPVMSERMQKGTSGSENTLVEREDQFPLVVFSHGELVQGGRRRKEADAVDTQAWEEDGRLIASTVESSLRGGTSSLRSNIEMGQVPSASCAKRTASAWWIISRLMT